MLVFALVFIVRCIIACYLQSSDQLWSQPVPRYDLFRAKMGDTEHRKCYSGELVMGFDVTAFVFPLYVAFFYEFYNLPNGSGLSHASGVVFQAIMMKWNIAKVTWVNWFWVLTLLCSCFLCVVLLYAFYSLPTSSGLSHARGVACFQVKWMKLNGAEVNWPNCAWSQMFFIIFPLFAVLLYAFYSLPNISGLCHAPGMAC